MNKVETLATLFGGKAQLAAIIGRSPAIITRMIRVGRIDPKYNKDLRDAISRLPGHVPPETIFDALQCLERDVCPTCGQAVPHGSVL